MAGVELTEIPAAPAFVSIDTAGRYLGLDQVAKDPKRAVLELARKGLLRTKRIGRWTLIEANSLESFAATR